MMNFIRTFVLCSLDIALTILDKWEADVRFAMVEDLVDQVFCELRET